MSTPIIDNDVMLEAGGTLREMGLGKGIWTKDYILKNALYIDLTGAKNGKLSGVYVYPGWTTDGVSGLPTLLGMRTEIVFNSINALVDILEISPVEGRHWVNKYDGKDWNGWKLVSGKPDIKTGFGNIGISSDSGNRFDLFAKLVCIYENNMYTIKGSGVVKNLALGNPNGVNYGINISAIANILGLNLGGSYSFGEVTFYKYSNGIFEKDVNRNGFGATLELSNGGFFRPARYYNESGGIGGWKIGSFANEDMIEFEIYVK